MLFCFDIGNRFQTDAGCSSKFLLCDSEISSGFNKSAGNGVCTCNCVYVYIHISIHICVPPKIRIIQVYPATESAEDESSQLDNEDNPNTEQPPESDNVAPEQQLDDQDTIESDPSGR